MKTIEELVTIEQQYIEERLNGVENIDFIGILQEENLTNEEFQYKKGEYYLKHFGPNTIDVSGSTVQEALAFDMEAIKKQQNTITYGSIAGRQVWYPTEDSYNKEYCIENNIITACMPYAGGVICTTPSDLEAFICAKNPPSLLSKVILDKLVKWIQSDTTAIVSLNNNDILIDGKKVFGIASFQKNDMVVYVFHVSFNIDLDMINKVCLKPMLKTPTALSEYINYNKDNLIEEMMSWLK